jgi:hypothetical protein
MKRCLRNLTWARPTAILTGLVPLAGLLATPAPAQTAQRQFPPSALRGMLQVTTAPEVLLNGAPARLSPGARLKDANNMLVLPATLAGQRMLVNYVRDPQGLVHEVWLLNSAEAQEKRPGLEPIINFNFASEADKPKRDDGKTPFNQLPVYPRQ